MRAARAMGVTGAVAVAAALTAGCADFANVTTVVDLRILGIMADPPEIYVDKDTLDTQTDPFHSEVTALVVDPHGAGRAISYGVLACGREIDTVTAATGRNGVVCEHNTDPAMPQSYEVIPPDMPASTAVGDGPEHHIVFGFDLSPALLSAAYGIDTAARDYAVQLPVILQMELATGGESIVATKRVIFSQQLPDRPAQKPNQNPTPTSITVYDVRDALANPVTPRNFPEGDVVTVAPGGQLWFEPMGTIAEAYATRTLTRDVPPQIVTTDVDAETLRFAFFATAGSFSPPETTTARSLLRDQDRVHVESQYSAPGVAPADPNVTIWIVAHDERGGTSFTRRQLTVGAP